MCWGTPAGPHFVGRRFQAVITRAALLPYGFRRRSRRPLSPFRRLDSTMISSPSSSPLSLSGSSRVWLSRLNFSQICMARCDYRSGTTLCAHPASSHHPCARWVESTLGSAQGPALCKGDTCAAHLTKSRLEDATQFHVLAQLRRHQHG
jgi:hypothetical protein